MEIVKYKLEQDSKGYTLVVYVEQPNSEFSQELGKNFEMKPLFREEVKLILNEHFPNVKVMSVKIVVGALLLGSFPVGALVTKAAETQSTSQISNIPYMTYTVKSGDTLYKIASSNGISVEQIRQLNNLTGNTIFVGKTLLLPFVQYTVTSGDTLSNIARKFSSTVDSIKVKNNLITNTILIGQRLLVPVINKSVPVTTESAPITQEPVITAPTFNNYTVVAGDTLYAIAKRFNTSVDEIKRINNLASNTLSIGQLLKIPVPTQVTVPVPPPIEPVSPPNTSVQFKEYIVIPGDTLSVVARKYNSTVSGIKAKNNLTTDMIYIGQKLLIPISSEPIVAKDITPPDIPISQFNQMVNGGNVLAYLISGTTEAKAKVSITLVDNANHTVTTNLTADENGLFSTNIDLSSLQDGKVVLSILAQDEVGNKGLANIANLTKDTIGPGTIQLSDFPTINQTNVNSYPITGKTEPNSTVDLTITSATNSITANVQTDENGLFTANIDLSTLQDGIVTVSALATDNSNNKSLASTTIITKDTIGPGTIQLSDFPTINQTNVNSYPITGKTEPNCTVDLTITSATDSIKATVQADANGNFSIPLDLRTLSDGELMIQAVSTDQYDNRGTTTQNSFTKDTLVNPVTSLLLENNGKINNEIAATFNISGTTEEDGGIVTMEITDGVNTIKEDAIVLTSSFDRQIDLSSLNDGALLVKITHRDGVGNISDVTTATIQKDTIVNDPVVFTSKVQKTTTGFIYKLIGQGEPFSTVAVTVMGQTGTQEVRRTVTTDGDGRFELDVDISVIGNSKPFVTISQLDSFRNTSKTAIVGITSYVVGSGDSLWGIANRFNTSVDKITALNGLTSTNLRIGQELILPSVAGISSPIINEQQFFNMGYLYFGNSQTYIESVRHAENTINVVSPSYFDLNSNGTLKLTTQFDRQFIATMQSAGLRVVPFLSNHWDRATGEMALNNREQLSNQIAETIRLYNLDGVNIDIENVTEEYRDEYTDFVRLLNEKIPENKEVSVAVAANPNGWMNGWHGSYDYAELAKYSDYLMIMAYDESYFGSDPGPIASISFVEQSIQYALTRGVAENQIVVGVGHYGRYWKEGSATGGDGISNNQIQSALNMYNGTISYDEATQSAKAIFTINKGDPTMTINGKVLTEGTYTIWFENSTAIKAKIDLVHQYGVKGLGNWSLGQDNPEIWKDISSWLNPETTEVDGNVNP